jgi:hypothetical protein
MEGPARRGIGPSGNFLGAPRLRLFGMAVSHHTVADVRSDLKLTGQMPSDDLRPALHKQTRKTSAHRNAKWEFAHGCIVVYIGVFGGMVPMSKIGAMPCLRASIQKSGIVLGAAS